MADSRRDMLGDMAALGLGIAAFFVFAGWWVLIPTNIAWLEVGDRAMHTLGWFYYRDAPWGIPLGDSPHLGLELGSSIALVDGLPLFAIPLKLISAWLPRPFQYWGYWWFLCFVLQALFGYRLALALGAPRRIALLAAAFTIITPAFLYRLPLHMALAGHWVILASLWLFARRSPPPLSAWPLLCGVTGAIHAYLLAMVVAIWFAALVQRWLLASSSRSRLAGEAVVLAAVLAIVLWTVGFFYVGSVDSVGFGYYRLNLLAPLITHRAWSQWVPPLEHSDYDYEGQAFLGIGIYAAIVIAVVTGSILDFRLIATKRWWPLALLLLLFTLFALSNVVGLLNREAQPIPLPPFLEKVGATFRSSGRFVWPALYSLTVTVVVLAARRLSLRLATPLLAVLLAVQIYDSRQGWGEFRAFVASPGTTWHSSLTSPFWERAATSGLRKIRAVRQRLRATDWKDVEDFAYRHGMQTDVAYLGRIDVNTLIALYAHEQDAIAKGSLDLDTLYLLDFVNARAVAEHLAADDLFAVIDREIVYVRHGANLVDGLGIDPQGARHISRWVPDAIAFPDVPAWLAVLARSG